MGQIWRRARVTFAVQERAVAKNGSCFSWSRDDRGFKLHSERSTHDGAISQLLTWTSELQGMFFFVLFFFLLQIAFLCRYEKI